MSDFLLTLNLDLGYHHKTQNPSFALRVDLTIGHGFTMLYGHSGAGKSTLLQAIAGLHTPLRGQIRCGSELWFCSDSGVSLAPEKRGVAYLFQNLALFPHLNVLQNTCFGMHRTISKSQKRQQALSLLEKVGVVHLADRKPRSLSGGEAQRVALARAIASHPKVLLLDEPFSALDQERRKQLYTLVRSLVSDLQIPVLHVTHSQNDIKALGQRILKVEQGKIVEDTTHF